MHARPRPARVRAVIALAAAAIAASSLAIAAGGRAQPNAADRAQPGRALLVLTGPDGGAQQPVWTIARSQEVLREAWIEVRGEGVATAAQGWPLVPQVDFDRCEAILIARGPSHNANGYRVIEVTEDEGSVTVRVARDAFQTAGMGPGGGRVASNPWALILIPRTDKTIFLHENTQNLIGGEPIWTERAAFPGLIGVGTPVPGTRQTGPAGAAWVDPRP